MLLARFYEAPSLVFPICLAEVWIIVFITDAGTMWKILGHLG
jgi:hypothetical protein